MYMSSKTERMQTGPACRKYTLTIDDWVGKTEYNDEVWKKVNLPHDFVIEEKPLQTAAILIKISHFILIFFFVIVLSLVSPLLLILRFIIAAGILTAF